MGCHESVVKFHLRRKASLNYDQKEFHNYPEFIFSY